MFSLLSSSIKPSAKKYTERSTHLNVLHKDYAKLCNSRLKIASKQRSDLLKGHFILGQNKLKILNVTPFQLKPLIPTRFSPVQNLLF